MCTQVCIHALSTQARVPTRAHRREKHTHVYTHTHTPAYVHTHTSSDALASPRARCLHPTQGSPDTETQAHALDFSSSLLSKPIASC